MGGGVVPGMWDRVVGLSARYVPNRKGTGFERWLEEPLLWELLVGVLVQPPSLRPWQFP
jgi:hypothetical protein